MTTLRYEKFIKMALKVIIPLSVYSSTTEGWTKSVWSEALIVVWRAPPKEAPKDVWDHNCISKRFIRGVIRVCSISNEKKLGEASNMIWSECYFMAKYTYIWYNTQLATFCLSRYECSSAWSEPTIGFTFAGTCFWRYPLNGRIDQNETRDQGVSACDLIFRNILITKNQIFRVLPLACNVKHLAGSVQTKQSPRKSYGCQPWLGLRSVIDSSAQPTLPRRSAGLCRSGP